MKKESIFCLILIILISALIIISNAPEKNMITGDAIVDVSKGQVFAVNIPYDQNWEVVAYGKFDYGGFTRHFSSISPVLHPDWFSHIDSRLLHRIADKNICFTNAYVGKVTGTPCGSDHTCGSIPLSGLGDGGNHEMKINYLYDNQRYKVYWDGSLVMDCRMSYKNIPGPMKSLEAKGFSGTFSYNLLCDEGDIRNQGNICIADKMLASNNYQQVNAKGVCVFGTRKQVCNSNHEWEWGACESSTGQGDKIEACNGMDDDCDGLTDEGCDDDNDGYLDGTMACGANPYKKQYGWRDSIPAPADFDGDGIDDFVVYCGNCDEDKDWWIQYSSDNSLEQKDMGWQNSIPAPADFDGDGIDDLAVYCGDCEGQDDWWIMNTATDSFVQKDFGWQASIPAPGDFDGDGMDDLVVYCGDCDGSKDWWIQYSSNNEFVQKDFGWSASIPAPADFDGDGKDDFVVYCGNCDEDKDWWIQYSSNNEVEQIDFGWQDSIPAPADFDGDGIDDLAVYYPDAGIWYIKCDDCRGLINVENNKGCLNRDLNDNDPDVETTWDCEIDSDCIDDGNVCTTEECVNNNCVNNDNTDLCNDNDACTENDVCSQGVCNGTLIDCTDNIPCTYDYCENGVCLHDAADCACEIDSDCPDDNNTCTSVSCVNQICKTGYLNISCNDNDDCTENDTCTQGTCNGMDVEVDDGDAFTYDFCEDGIIKHENFEAGRTYSFPADDGLGDVPVIIVDGQIVPLDTSLDITTGDDVADDGKEKSNLVWIWVLVAAIIVVAGLIVFYAFRKPNLRN